MIVRGALVTHEKTLVTQPLNSLFAARYTCWSSLRDWASPRFTHGRFTDGAIEAVSFQNTGRLTIALGCAVIYVTATLLPKLRQVADIAIVDVADLLHFLE